MLNIRTSFIRFISRKKNGKSYRVLSNPNSKQVVDTTIDPHYRKISKNEGK